MVFRTLGSHGRIVCGLILALCLGVPGGAAACQFDGKTVQPGEWYVPADKSAVYAVTSDCKLELKANAWNVWLVQRANEAWDAYYMWPSKGQPPPRYYYPSNLSPPTNLRSISWTPFSSSSLALLDDSNLVETQALLLVQAGAAATAFPFMLVAANSAATQALALAATDATVALIAGIELVFGTAAAGVLVPVVVVAGAVVITATMANQVLAKKVQPRMYDAGFPSWELFDKEFATYDKFPVTARANELSDSGKPGCNDPTYQALKSEQKELCKNGIACRDRRSDEGLEVYIQEQEATLLNRWKCAQVRRDIMDICFDRGNQGHRDQWRNVLLQVEKCKNFLANLPPRMSAIDVLTTGEPSRSWIQPVTAEEGAW